MKRTVDIRDYTRSFFRGNWLNYFGTLGLTLLLVLPNLFFSWLLGEILDIIAVGDLSALLRILCLTILFITLEFLVTIANYRLRTRFIRRGMSQYRSLAFSRLVQKNISAFTRENTSRYLSALTNDATSLSTNYISVTISIAYNAVLFLATLIMMFWYSWPLALCAIVLSVLPILAASLLGGELSNRDKQCSHKNEHFVSVVKDMLIGFSVIKSFKAESQMHRRFDQANEQLEQTKAHRNWWNYLLSATSSTAGILLQFGIFLFGAWLAIRGDITGGTVFIMVNLCNFLIQPIQNIPAFLGDRKASLGLIEKLAQAVEENNEEGGRSIPQILSDSISLEHLTFGYEADKPVLKDITLRFEAGRKYAIVGSSGSGKSTLLNLLMGAYRDYAGELTIDGVQLRDIDPDSLYDLNSLIGQTVFLFDDTLENNITMFGEFPPEQIADAVKRSGLSEFAVRRGMDYSCGENGVNLSGGERQRVSIARCLLQGTPVLLMDEATAALDNQTAFAVTDAILHLDGLTRVVVTHRLDAALLEQYDDIIVLKDGRVQEQGRFADLLERKGYFYSLFTLAA